MYLNAAQELFLQQQQKPYISVRIVSVDHALATPIPGVDLTETPFARPPAVPDENISLVPNIRIFGTTPFGQKVCVHVHEVLPYFFIKYEGASDDKNESKSCSPCSFEPEHVY
jgi:hypothetical protein